MRRNPSSTTVVFTFVFFLCFKIFFIEMAMTTQNTTFIPVNVGVVLDLDELDCKIWLSCINMAFSDFYATHGHFKTRLVPKPRDSNKSVFGAAAAALDLIKNEEVQAILGPQSSMQANFLAQLGEEAQVPIITFSASSPTLTSIRNPYFLRAAQNDSIETKAISAMVQHFGWTEVVLIYVDNEYGRGVIPYLTDALEAVHARVPYQSVISPTATDQEIFEELNKLKRKRTRVFFVQMSPTLGARFFAKAKEIEMMNEGYVWILTQWLTATTVLLSSTDPAVSDSMQGVLGVKYYVPRTTKLKNFRVRWKTKFLQENPNCIDAELDIYGLWAYDAATALAMAVEKAGTTTNFGFRRANVSTNSSTDLATLGVSLNGPNLIQALPSASFKGLAGDFQIVNGQLQASVFQIVNKNGNGEREIGFWTPTEGLIKKLASTSNPTTISGLSTVIWPGETTSVPKGWDPANGKRLRVGVPVKKGFQQFVAVTRYPSSNSTKKVSGYCIDIFEAVVKQLPYPLPFEFIPFAKPDGEPAGNYDDLIHQVSEEKYDAVVGDVTILASRSLHIEFTLPYTESGVSMIVQVEDNENKNAWAFLKPLTWDLWLASICFFIFIGFVVWVLEHRINEDFRGPPSVQAGNSVWFSFSTMVFAQREKVVSNLSRMVVIIWCFVVFILTQSYTASLSSLLTVQQLQPTVTDLYELIKKEEYVGYQKNSFVGDILLSLGFHSSKLVEYNSPEECDELFSKGRGNGGIAAAFDEVPYMKLFMSKYCSYSDQENKHCSNYTMIRTSIKASGFGFVFPKGSPLASDVSTAFLNVTGARMNEIEGKWLGKQSYYPDSSTTFSSSSLSLKNFWGLFLLCGIASLLALIMFAAMFLYENRGELLFPSDSNASIWSRILALFRIFNQKDLRHYTFNKDVKGPAIICPIHVAFHGDRPEPAGAELSDSKPRAEPPLQEDAQMVNSDTEKKH